MHTACWDHTVDLSGKRVAVIGTGASAVQVIPELAPIVKQSACFSGTPIWCSQLDAPMSRAARLAMRVPGSKTVQRMLSQAFVEFTFLLAAKLLHPQPVCPQHGRGRTQHTCASRSGDPEWGKLTPWYAVGCKRPGFHNTTCRRSTATPWS